LTTWPGWPASAQSMHSAVDDLPAAQRAALEAAVLLVDDADEDDLLALDPDADRDALLAALADLRDRLLVTETGLRPLGLVRQYLPVPLGLGRPVALVHEHTPLYELERMLGLYGERAPHTRAAARAAGHGAVQHSGAGRLLARPAARTAGGAPALRPGGTGAARAGSERLGGPAAG
jgi:hypothetical protein